jgi:hypothetical protein
LEQICLLLGFHRNLYIHMVKSLTYWAKYPFNFS